MHLSSSVQPFSGVFLTRLATRHSVWFLSCVHSCRSEPWPDGSTSALHCLVQGPLHCCTPGMYADTGLRHACEEEWEWALTCEFLAACNFKPAAVPREL